MPIGTSSPFSTTSLTREWDRKFPRFPALLERNRTYRHLAPLPLPFPFTTPIIVLAERNAALLLSGFRLYIMFRKTVMRPGPLRRMAVAESPIMTFLLPTLHTLGIIYHV